MSFWRPEGGLRADMLRGMVAKATTAVREIANGMWGMGRAREVAREVEGSRAAVGALVEEMFGTDLEVRKRAADVARRITERSAEPLWRYAEVLAGLLLEIDPEEARTRWHLGLVVARVAHTAEQRLRAGRLMEMLASDDGNAVRCSAIEGLGWLACEEHSLSGVAEELARRALQSGTKAEMCRARASLKRLERAGVIETSGSRR